MRIRHRQLLLGLAVALLATACTTGRADLEQWVAQQKNESAPPLPPLPEIKTFETFIYQAQDLRDPFGANRTAEDTGAAQAGPRPDPNRAKEPLEQFALDSLEMVGTIGTGPGMRALLQDPEGIIHRVHQDNYVGKNYGHIIGITEDHIDLVELVPNGNGGWMEREASIALGDEDKP